MDETLSRDAHLPASEQSADAVTLSGIDRLLYWLSIYGPYIALLTAWVAMSGSLFLSDVWGWLPCVLCWYQRILMYPLTLILAVGILRQDRGLPLYVLPFSLIGMGTALYHYMLVKTDWFPPPPCSVGIPCTTEYLNLFGFINIPFLSLVAFAIISVMVAALPMRADFEALSKAADGTDNQARPPRPAWLTTWLPVVGIIALVVGVFLTIGTLEAQRQAETLGAMVGWLAGMG